MNITLSDSIMSKEVIGAPSAAPFDFEILDSDSDIVRSVRASSKRANPWIEPERLKLRHRIGRGLFGDVWLATHHQSTEDYDEYHEVAAKMLPAIGDDHMKIVIEKFNELYFKCQGVASMSWLHGISILNGRVRLLLFINVLEILSYLFSCGWLTYLCVFTDMHHYEFV